MFRLLKRSEEDKKIQNYVLEYKKLMKRFMRFRNKNEKKREENDILCDIYPLEKEPIEESNPITHLIRKLSALLKTENYAVKKSFVDMLLNSIKKGRHNILDPVIFYEIFIPVFVEEYKKDNAKYIEWIGRYNELFPFTREFLKQIDALEADDGTIVTFKKYFLGKSFMISKTPIILDQFIRLTQEEFEFSIVKLSVRLKASKLEFCGNDLHKKLEEIKEELKPYIDKLEKCKLYCKIAGINKLEKRVKNFLGDWEIYVTSICKYLEHVEKNGYVKLADYQEKLNDA